MSAPSYGTSEPAEQLLEVVSAPSTLTDPQLALLVALAARKPLQGPFTTVRSDVILEEADKYLDWLRSNETVGPGQ